VGVILGGGEVRKTIDGKARPVAEGRFARKEREGIKTGG